MSILKIKYTNLQVANFLYIFNTFPIVNSLGPKRTYSRAPGLKRIQDLELKFISSVTFLIKFVPIRASFIKK